MRTTPRRSDYLTVREYLEAWEYEYALQRDEQLTAAERSAANQALAQAQGVYWRPEWVMRA